MSRANEDNATLHRGYTAARCMAALPVFPEGPRRVALSMTIGRVAIPRETKGRRLAQ